MKASTRMVCCFSVLIGLCGLVTAVNAQQKYFFTSFTPSEGLSNNSIHDIVQDHDGFIWIATDDGLNRFDGHRFKTFRHVESNVNSLPENAVEVLYMDRAGGLWCGGPGWNSVARLEKGSFAFVNVPLGDGERAYDIKGIVSDKIGNTWVFTSDEIFYSDSSAMRFVSCGDNETKIPHPLGNGVITSNCIAVDPMDRGFWVATNQGINFYDFQKKEFFHRENNPGDRKIFKFKTPRTLVSDKDGHIWFGQKVAPEWLSWMGYDYDSDSVMYSTDTIPIDGIRQLNYFAALACSPSNVLWLGNNGRTPLLFDVKNHSFNSSLASVYPGCLGNQTIRSTLFDTGGNTWVGTEQGLYVALKEYTRANVNWIGDITKFQKPRIKSLFPVDSDQVAMAANTEIYWWDRRTDKVSTIPIKINGKIIEEDTRYLARKSADEIWVATFFGLYSYHLKTHLFTDELTKLPEGWIKNLRTNSNLSFVFTDEAGFNYICTKTELFIFSKEKNFYRRTQLNSDEGKRLRINGYCSRKDGGYWFCTSPGAGVFYIESPLDSAVRLTRLNDATFSPYTLVEDNSGNLWLGSVTSGIIKLSLATGSIHKFSIDDGLHSNCVYKLLCSDNAIYCITSNGIAKYNEQFDRFERIFSEYALSNYPHRDVGSVGPTGEIWSFSENIFYSIEKNIPNGSYKHNKVVITSVNVMNTEYGLTQFDMLRHLSHDQNTISIEFSDLNFNPNVKVRYQYQLARMGNDWLDDAGKSNVVFTGLSPGSYTFRVRSDRGTGIFSDDYTVLPFVISPPWYSTWWFRLLLILTLLGGVAWLIRQYTSRRIRRRELEYEKIRLIEEERLRIARDMHDDLGSGLSTIRMISEKAMKGQENAAFKEISDTSVELVDRMRQIVWTLNEEQNTVEDLLYYIVVYARDYLRRNAVSAHFSEIPISDLTLTSGQRRSIFMVVKEALHNVVRHSGAGEVGFVFEMHENRLGISIHDNGRGLRQELDNRFGNGLKNMRMRIQDLGGTLEFENENGLKIFLKVPLASNKS